jgi:hypothetical protein
VTFAPTPNLWKLQSTAQREAICGAEARCSTVKSKIGPIQVGHAECSRERVALSPRMNSKSATNLNRADFAPDERKNPVHIRTCDGKHPRAIAGAPGVGRTALALPMA